MNEIEKINAMSRFEMCSLWRFAPVGHPYFVQGTPEYGLLKNVLESLADLLLL